MRYREPSIWEQYRWPLLGSFAVVSFLVGMITWLLLERRSRRKAEVESHRRLLEVIHLSRSAEAGALSASFAHELSQPLVAINLNAENAKCLLGEQPYDVERVKELLREIKDANEHATQVISRLKVLLKRKNAAETRDCDLNESIAQAMSILLPEVKKQSVVLRVTGAKHPLRVQADGVHLQQAILNLARNGMDAMADNARDARSMVIQTSMRDSKTVEVSVSDTGSGIPEDKISKIFDTFFTTKENGLGLGLAITRTIVENYGGKIWAESPAGGGATFHFTLPLFPPPRRNSYYASPRYELAGNEQNAEAVT